MPMINSPECADVHLPKGTDALFGATTTGDRNLRRARLRELQTGPTPNIDRAVARVAGLQHGIITSAQLQACGMTSGAITRRVRAGRLHRLHHGVYAVGHTSLPWIARCMAAVLAAGPGAVLARSSAARLWSISRTPGDAIHVVAPVRHRSISGVAVHYTRDLPHRDFTSKDGVPVTTVSRTLVDLASDHDEYELAACMDEARFRNHMDVEATRGLALEHPGRRGHARLLVALEMHATGSAGTKSALERRFLKLVRRAGISEPRVNVWVHVENGDLEVDNLWEAQRIIVMIDGGSDGTGHGRARMQVEDRSSSNRLEACGYTVVRVIDSDLVHRPTHVIRRVRAALAAA